MNESGLKAVFLEERPTLVRLLIARLGSREEAEDVTQEMWLKLEQLAPKPVSQPAAYLFRMAANLASDRRISAARGGVRNSAWLEAQPAAEELPGAERALLARERLAHVETALAAMPERMRAALRMYRLEELPQKQIAENLGMTLSGVEKLLRRAVRQLHDTGRNGAMADSGERCRLDSEQGSQSDD